MNQRMSSYLPNWIFGCFALTLAVGAQAAPTLEEVVVTARKISENLQEVPVAVSSFSADLIDEQGFTTIEELAHQSPNVTLEASRATNSTLTAYIRGIGQQDPLWGFEPGIGIYIDDVYFARPQAALLDIYDVERIEVLRGPQGSLYGKNTIGGAIKYVTRSPEGAAAFNIEGDFGSYGQRDLKLSGAIPLIEDQLWIGGGFASLKRDGFGEYVGPINKNVENYDKEVLAGRISLAWRPTENLFVRVEADKVEDRSNNRGGDRLTPSLLTGEPTLGDVYDTRSEIDPKQKVETEGYSLTVDWDISEYWSLKSITAHREGDTFTSIDFDNLQIIATEAPGTVYDDEQFSQEFQLSYETEQFKGVAGLYYFDGEAGGDFSLLLSGGVVRVNDRGRVDTTSKAAYAQGTYYWNDQWSFTLGGRFTDDEKDADVFFATFIAGNLVLLNSDFSQSDSWSEFSPRLGVEYRANDNVMFYASYAKGFKSGGIDPRANKAANPTADVPFEPETVATYEVGVKSELFESRVRANATLFINDYTDQQVTTSILIDADGDGNPEGFAGQVVNAGKASAWGLEVESLAALTDNLELSLVLGYIDAEIDKFISVDPVTLEPVDLSDQRVVSNTPELTGNLGLTYRGEIGGGALVLNANLVYRDDIHLFETKAPIDENSFTLVNANLAWTDSSGNWRVGLHGKNLTDKEYRVAGYNFPNLGGESSVIGYYGAPRTVTLTLGYSF